MKVSLMSGLLALVVSSALAPAVLALLRRGQVLDHPTERSSHTSPVPRGGGTAVAVGALVALALTPDLGAPVRLAMAAAATLFGLIGLAEDLAGIRPLRRLAVQFGVAGIAGSLLFEPQLGPRNWGLLITTGVILWLVAFANCFNFMDGIDGISVCQSTVAGVTWLVVGMIAESMVLATGGAIIAGATLGFAPYNVPHARMFLGDVGSYFIGAWLAAVAFLALRDGLPPEAVLAPLVLYAADTGSTLFRRVVRGEPWYRPHRGHTYQRISDAGWSHMNATALVAACIALCGGLGAVSLVGSLVARVAAGTAIALIVVGYLMTPLWLGRRNTTIAS